MKDLVGFIALMPSYTYPMTILGKSASNCRWALIAAVFGCWDDIVSCAAHCSFLGSEVLHIPPKWNTHRREIMGRSSRQRVR
jgi:hypothetical protein